MVTDGATFRWSSLQFTSCRNSITFTFESCDTISKWFGLFTDLLYNDWEFRATSQAKFRQVKLRFRKEKRKRKKKREKKSSLPLDKTDLRMMHGSQDLITYKLSRLDWIDWVMAPAATWPRQSVTDSCRSQWPLICITPSFIHRTQEPLCESRGGLRFLMDVKPQKKASTKTSPGGRNVEHRVQARSIGRRWAGRRWGPGEIKRRERVVLDPQVNPPEKRSSLE